MHHTYVLLRSSNTPKYSTYSHFQVFRRVLAPAFGLRGEMIKRDARILIAEAKSKLGQRVWARTTMRTPICTLTRMRSCTYALNHSCARYLRTDGSIKCAGCYFEGGHKAHQRGEAAQFEAPFESLVIYTRGACHMWRVSSSRIKTACSLWCRW